MFDRLLKGQPKSSWKLNLVATVGLVAAVGALYQWWYQTEVLPRECCAYHTRKMIPGILIRNQQRIFLEQGRFASSVEELEKISAFSIDPEMRKRYEYSVTADSNRTIIRATAKREGFRSYVGGAFVVTQPKPDDHLTLGILCEANAIVQQSLAAPINGKTCPTGTTKHDR